MRGEDLEDSSLYYEMHDEHPCWYEEWSLEELEQLKLEDEEIVAEQDKLKDSCGR